MTDLPHVDICNFCFESVDFDGVEWSGVEIISADVLSEWGPHQAVTGTTNGSEFGLFCF